MRRITALAGALALASAAFLATTGSASAHADLTSSDPSDGAVLTAPPSSVTLTFNEPLLEETVDVAIEGSEGLIATDAAQADGPTVLIPWPAAATQGEFSVNYRVVSADGHPVEGSVRFSIEASQTDAAASAAPSEAALPADAAATDAASPDEAAVPTEFETSDEVNWPFVVIIMVLGIAGFAALLIASRAAREKRRQ